VFGDDGNSERFEDMVRSIVREVSRSMEGMAGELEQLAGPAGVDPERAREWVDEAGRWLRGRVGDETPSGGTSSAGAAEPVDPLRSAGPHPLDLPTDEQGVALSALASGRWTVEPGSNARVADGQGPAPSAALGLVGELRARDWIAADGTVTAVGRHALSRWLDAAGSR
jgi:hypothetical protein